MTKVIGAALFSALLLFSCEQPYDFSEYDDTNLIPSQGFDSGDWEPDQTAPYVNFEEVTDSDPGYPGAPGGDTEEPVYRVETRNLFPNGDFETSTVGNFPAEWKKTGGVTADVIDNANAINGNSFDIEFPAGDAIFTDPDLATLLGGAFEAGSPYRFLFDFKSASDVVGAELNDGYSGSESKTGYSWSIGRPQAADSNTVVAFPEDPSFRTNNVIQADNTFDSFSFGGYSDKAAVTVSAIIDNFRVVKDDIPLFLRLPVPRNASGRPELLDGGTYTFKIMVRDDPTVHDTAAGGGNRFRADALTVSLNPYPGEETATAPVTQTRSGSWSSWTELSFEIDGFQLSDGGDNDTVLEILLLPSGTGNKLDVGSLLVANPQLYWSQN